MDWYDDSLATLKVKFPTAEQLPDVIKEAAVKPSHEVANEQFALVALDEGNVLRKYACHDPGTTALSVIYFMEHGDKLPEEAQKTAAVNLYNACLAHELAPPKALEKVAFGGPMAMPAAPGGAMPPAGGGQKKALYSPTARIEGEIEGMKRCLKILGGGTDLGEQQKMAGVVDITGKSPTPKVKTARPANDEDYAVVMRDGSRHYPIDTWDRVKLAEDYYQENRLRMVPEVRRQFAVKLARKAINLGYPLEYEIFEKGASTYARTGHLKSAIEMRKVACAPGEERAWLDELFEKRAHMAPDVYAACLHQFDVENSLDRGWDHVVLDPWESTFGINKVAEVVWEQGADRVTDDQLQNLAQNQHSGMDELFTHDIAKEFIKDPVGIFNSMPDPQKKIIARLANDLVSQGGSEVAVVG